MSRKRCHRRYVPPPGLRPDQVRDLGLAHIANLDAISRGQGTEDILWQWIGGALTWAYVASTLERRDFPRYHEAGESMRLQLELATSVVERYGRTGRVGFSGTEYQQAKDACEWMDALAAVVDLPLAKRAAEMSERSVNQMAAEHGQREAHAA
jgi:hypothetical protein